MGSLANLGSDRLPPVYVLPDGRAIHDRFGRYTRRAHDPCVFL
jgi:hypothetical protein